ncbi:MAG: hypothetical protein ABFD91_17480 [Anaerohalosphaeraceae bacterium]
MTILRIFGKTVKILLIILMGYILLNFTFQFWQGPERSFDLGDRYQLNSCPGTLIYWKSDNHHEGREQPFIGSVDVFYIENPWVVGRVNRSKWFAIQKNNHETHYPLASLNEIKEVTGLNIKESDLITNPYNQWFPSRYEIINPWVKIIVGAEAVIYITILLICYKLKAKLTKTNAKALSIES